MTDHPGGQLFDQRSASLAALGRHTLQFQRLAFHRDRSQHGRLSLGIRTQPAPNTLLRFAFEFGRTASSAAGSVTSNRIRVIRTSSPSAFISCGTGGSKWQLIQASWKKGAISLKNSVSFESGYSSR